MRKSRRMRDSAINEEGGRRRMQGVRREWDAEKEEEVTSDGGDKKAVGE